MRVYNLNSQLETLPALDRSPPLVAYFISGLWSSYFLFDNGLFGCYLGRQNVLGSLQLPFISCTHKMHHLGGGYSATGQILCFGGKFLKKLGRFFILGNIFLFLVKKTEI